ncbi:MAG: hypothetical protein A3J63_02415 [Candidatus Moranbacteria bacterium RIFCSPHIGHO2_02_FULL_40_12b]|nr:MAG: hypothetical protein A3J63_02415 [Candidatus Moranbacteria bacterium RIFCSPHIGHO2_02_FULL_40_12b]OGI23763.1 MAG: hypothetical protein A3E91_02945 [Candidatus Moranbacteria bacterium RIFCSPHIGHO2_12_FULL_40_10]
MEKITYKKYSWVVFRVAVLVYLGFGLLLYFNQRGFMYYPAMGDPKACAEFQKSGAQKIIQNGTALYYRPGGKKLVVFYHGNAGTVCDRKFLADYFANQNIAYLFVEYAGYGDKRKTNQAALEQNVRDAAEFIKGLSFDELVIMGESLGTSLANYHVNLTAPEKLLLLSPYPSMAAAAAAHYPVYPTRWMIKDDYRTNWAGRNFSGQLLVIHGRKDNIIPSVLGEQFFAEAPFAEKEFFPVENAGHNDLYEDAGVWKKIGAFITE